MKKQYEKPLVAIEYYELTQAIAACSLKVGFLDQQCVLKDPDSTDHMRNLAMKFYFTSGGTGCNNVPGGMTIEDGICYHTNANTAFNS